MKKSASLPALCLLITAGHAAAAADSTLTSAGDAQPPAVRVTIYKIN